MYLGIDVGGTKTLVAVLDSKGRIKEEVRFPTPKTYAHFLLELRHTLAHLEAKDFAAGAIAIPGRIDREHGRAVRLGNLPWKNINVQHDVERIADCPITVENDAKIGGLYEATLLDKKYSEVLYVTVSTGIGYAVIRDGRIDVNVGDGGGSNILLEHRGKLAPWEEFASGRAIVERYHKKARDITDEADWKHICRDLAKGLVQVIAMSQPEVVVIGGSVGTYFDRYGDLLRAEIKKYHLPMTNLPDLLPAQNSEEAVIYGCYELVKQVFPHAVAHK
jgi:glucokinase